MRMVVETTNINTTQRNTGGTFLSKNGKLTERFTRINDNQILYAFEVKRLDGLHAGVARGDAAEPAEAGGLRVRLP